MKSADADKSIETSNFWENHYSFFDEYKPSDFAKKFASRYVEDETNIIELGCGNGRDALYLIDLCMKYVGIDISKTGIQKALNKVQKENLIGKSKFICADFTTMDFSEYANSKNLFYSRFTFHSITYQQQETLISNFLKLPADKNILIFEARTIHDEFYGIGEEVEKNAYVSDHFRRFIDPLEVRKILQENFEILEWQEGKDLATYKEENPYVLRVALRKIGINNDL